MKIQVDVAEDLKSIKYSTKGKGSIEICPECDGTGEVWDGDMSEPTNRMIQCKVCLGKRTVRQATITVQTLIPSTWPERD